MNAALDEWRVRWVKSHQDYERLHQQWTAALTAGDHAHVSQLHDKLAVGVVDRDALFAEYLTITGRWSHGVLLSQCGHEFGSCDCSHLYPPR